MPLPPQAIAILRRLQEITGHGKLVFPSVRSELRPISDNTLNAALRRLGDSLVDLDAKQIAAMHRDTSKRGLPLFRKFVADRVAEATKARAEIQAAPGTKEEAKDTGEEEEDHEAAE